MGFARRAVHDVDRNGRRTDEGIIDVRVAGFEEGNGDVGILGEARGERASGDLSVKKPVSENMWVPNEEGAALTPPPVHSQSG